MSITMFQSLDWVDVDFDMTLVPVSAVVGGFQSLDWVDVDFDLQVKGIPTVISVSIPRLG